ncbi:FimB/Mfa2 family fimbrial subunit [Bacteroides cellulosilyticus]|nr:FimB/Mfa2 family fimbrial subunit [Bacteroides cellulosilyticus]
MALSATSCEWVKDDLPECPPTELRVGFKYDYHIFGGDVFSEHVGAVYVYLFDRNNKFLSLHTETNPEVLGKRGYEMVLNDLEPDRYRLVTIAFQRSCEEMYGRAGAKFRIPDMQAGDPIEKLEVTLDRKKNTDDGRSYVVHENAPLDTLWMNRTKNTVETGFQETTRTLVDLMRHTKQLTITLRQVNDPANIDCNDFSIGLTDDNGCVRHDCSIKADDELLTYTPHTMWTSEYSDDNHNEMQRAAHADMSLARLIYSEEWSQNALLTIFNKETGVEVARVNLPEILVSGRNTAEQSYSEQEYLDREHAYKLDFFLVGDTWQYINVTVGVLSWQVRNQNADL